MSLMFVFVCYYQPAFAVELDCRDMSNTHGSDKKVSKSFKLSIDFDTNTAAVKHGDWTEPRVEFIKVYDNAITWFFYEKDYRGLVHYWFWTDTGRGNTQNIIGPQMANDYQEFQCFGNLTPNLRSKNIN